MTGIINGNGHVRSQKVRRNIAASLVIKGITVLIGFMIVPITLNYLDQTSYGIWLTLTSLVAWFSFFDIGLGNGLRNKLSEALAKNDILLAKKYVSTTYAILSIICSVTGIIFIIGNQYINWSKVLNTGSIMNPQLAAVALVIFGFFFLQFVLNLIGIVLMSDQRPAMSNLFSPAANLISLAAIYILSHTTHGSLLYLSFAMSSAPVLVLIAASFILYSGRYRNISPSFAHVDFTYSRELLGLGVRFFLIQVSGIILFQSSNIMIAQFFGPREVTPYNIAYKYFSITLMIFTIVIAPFWSAFTEAWVKKDIEWIRKTVRILLLIWFVMFALNILMLIFGNAFFRLWLGKKVFAGMYMTWSLKITLCIYFLTYTFGGVYNMFINGLGKLTLQLYLSFFGALMFIPVSLVLIRYFHMGMEAIVIAMIVSNFYGPFVAPVQYRKLITLTARGLWNR